MELEPYIKVMAESCFQIYEEMTGHTAEGVKIEALEPPFSTFTYKNAIVIPYEKTDAFLDGRFILGFNDQAMAVKLASAIAEKAGMALDDALNDMVTDILFEFMNTVAGKVITEWDDLGLDAEFFPPEFVVDLCLDADPQREVVIHAITVMLPNSGQLQILTCFETYDNRQLKAKTVLVVDDSRMIRSILAKEFEGQGCQVIEAENGLEAFVRYHSIEPDLIVMDLIMPKMGGLEAIAKIREINPSVPIIVLTSTSKKEEVMAAAAHNIKGYIKKPIKMDKLLALAAGCFQ
jgi:CheY-like chemotaxis protein/CheY-specific phosphatase CheX